MKIDRLMGIVTVLQQNKFVTAPFLAEKFEVSRRTINRDIEELCRAGIPIVTLQGNGGGISLMEGFSLDTTLFTRQELAAVLTGLKSLESVSNSAFAKRLAEKIGGSAAETLEDTMLIDLSSFYKKDLADKIGQIREAIQERRCIGFRYFYQKGESRRLIEPYLIVFKWSDWYVFGFCKERQDFRMFKLRRLWELETTDLIYDVREIPVGKKNFGSHMRDDYLTGAVYEATEKYRLVEEYGPESFAELENGKLFAGWGFENEEKALGWFLSFGDKVKVVEPPELVEKMKKMILSLNNLYQT